MDLPLKRLTVSILLQCGQTGPSGQREASRNSRAFSSFVKAGLVMSHMGLSPVSPYRTTVFQCSQVHSRPRGVIAASPDLQAPADSMQPRALEETAAVGRGDAHLQGAAVAIDGDRHLDPRIAERPDAAEQGCEVADVRAADREHDVAGAQVGAPRRAAAG